MKAVSYGSGRHAALLTEDQFSHAILWTMVAFLPGILSFGVPKLAVVALLTRMLNPSRIHAIIMWVVAIICLISLMGCVAILFGQCTPTHSMWTFSVKGKCWSPMVLVNYSIYAGCEIFPTSRPNEGLLTQIPTKPFLRLLIFTSPCILQLCCATCR